MQYINAEKLIAEIEKRIHSMENCPFRRAEFGAEKVEEGELIGYKSILSFITSLQQEQLMPDSTKLIELWHEDKEMLKEKDFRDDPWRLTYNAFMCGFGRGIAVNKQERPEVDLEKEIEKQIRSTFYDLDGIAIMGTSKYASVEDMEYVARHFYELGLNARKEE